MPQEFPEAALEKSLTDSLGIYIHIPFCEKKCNYCNFYSGKADKATRALYVERLCEEIKQWGTQTARPIDTLYIGGGTPSLLSEAELSQILSAVRSSFNLCDDAEITAEVNPSDREFIKYAAELGINRLSVGVQSASDEELKVLGRRHLFADAQKAVALARQEGINNISVDIMIGLENSSIETLDFSIDRILDLDAEHISAYILKIEEGTPFGARQVATPDEDSVADQYLHMCGRFAKAGYEHYEISNFAKKGFFSRHNTKYWLDREYIGIGPAAHSFFEGKRFFYPQDIKLFCEKAEITPDGVGGNDEEFVMLALRLKKGLVFSEYEEKFGKKLPLGAVNKAKLLENGGLCKVTQDSISLTDRGMLVSNSIICEIVGEII